MADLEFEHLHTHSHYSMLDGLSTIQSLVERAFEMDRKSVCVTDHGTLAGVPELFRTAKEYGLLPIAGMEAYICDDIKDRDVAMPKGAWDNKEGKIYDGRTKKAAYYHVSLLAQNLEGYRNLVRLSTIANTEGFYRRPRIDFDILNSHRSGIICLSGCIGGAPQQAIIAGNHNQARRYLDKYRQIFGRDRFILEMQDTDIPEQRIVNTAFRTFGKNGYHVCATVDSHYTYEHEAAAHDTLLCIGTRSKVNDDQRFRFNGHGYHYKSPEEMYELFDPEYLVETRRVVDMCDRYEIPKTGAMPKVHIPNNADPSNYLAQVAGRGLKDKFRGPVPSKYLERLRMELDVVRRLSYAPYFIMVADILEHARRNGVFVGPGRGSSAGSLLAYAIGITQVDPIKYGLYFERFLNKDRISPPDIDVDISDAGRPLVLAYVREKYGEENVAHIGSFSTLGPRQALRDIAVAHDVPEQRMNEALKHIPFDPMIKYEDVRQISGVKAGLGEHILSLGDSLHGKHRHNSTHAAGVIVSNGRLSDHIPLTKTKDGNLQTVYEYDELARLGYIKFDILGLTTLGVIQRVLNAVNVKWSDIMKLNDGSVYEMLSTGHTVGVFQLESWGYQQMIKRFKPREFEDIMMINAIYRPGPMGGGEGLETILRRRSGQEIPTYLHMALQPILSGTYGVMVYQEDVMRICVEFAGFTLSKADAMRSAIGKKKEAEIQALKVDFIRGCLAKGHRRDLADKLYADIEYFARYGWNKAHAAAYGMVTYATAYLKTYYPDHFMAEMMNSYLGNKDKMRTLIMEARRLGLRFIKPDVNKSGFGYSVTQPKCLMLGITSIKGVGDRAATAITEERKKGAFYSKSEFRERMPKKLINSAVYALLENAGAFNNLQELQDDVPF